jgi:hypothetical protein
MLYLRNGRVNEKVLIVVNCSRLKDQFFVSFAKLRKADISSVISVCPYVHPSAWNISAYTGRILVKFGI